MTTAQEKIIADFGKYQKEQKEKVEQGEISKDQAVINVLSKAAEMLESLKIKPWEIEQYSYMAQTIN